MKKLIILLLVVLVSLSITVSCFAEVEDQWQKFSASGEVKMTDSGIQLSGQGSSFVYGYGYKQQVDIDGYSFTCTLDRFVGYSGKDGLDMWYGAFLTKDLNWFDQSPCLIMLFRPAENNTVTIEALMMTSSLQLTPIMSQKTDIPVNDTIKVQISKDDGKWIMTVNEGILSADISPAASVFDMAGGKAYPVFGATNTNEEGMSFTLRQINGVSFAETSEIGSENTENNEVKSKDTPKEQDKASIIGNTSPEKKTSAVGFDAIWIMTGVIIFMAAAIMGLLWIILRKK